MNDILKLILPIGIAAVLIQVLFFGKPWWNLAVAVLMLFAWLNIKNSEKEDGKDANSESIDSSNKENH